MKAILSVLVALLVLSCSQHRPSNTETARANIESGLKEVLHDPDSYQFVKMSSFDSITNLDMMDAGIDFNLSLLPGKKRLLAAKERLIEAQKKGLRWGDSTKEDVEETQNAIDELASSIKTVKENTEKGIEQRKTASIDTVYNYTVEFTYRAKNKIGATVLSTRKVSLSKEMEVLDISGG